MTKFLTIEDRDYLVITPGYSSIDASVSEEFRDKLNDIVHQGNNYILIDMVNVRFIDSFGLASLISVLKNTKGNGDIALANLSQPVQTYFSLTRMDRVFKVFSN